MEVMETIDKQQYAQLLQWYIDAGVDEVIVGEPVNNLIAEAEVMPRQFQQQKQNAQYSESKPPLASSSNLQARITPPAEALKEATELAAQASSVEELKKAVESFEGCGLKKTARSTVFADGNPQSDIMIIGEGPGSEEDRQGIPFCGPSGNLLNKMFQAIGYDRDNLYISNVVFWRPPGNRTPTPEELMICRPFVDRHIELAKPKILVFMGGTSAKFLLDSSVGITRLRGKEHSYKNENMENEIPARVIFHPSYLLRQPAQKKLAWQDLLELKAFISNEL